MPQNTNPDTSTAAPADAKPHLLWPLWRRIGAYVILILASVLAIELVDRKVQLPSLVQSPVHPIARSK